MRLNATRLGSIASSRSFGDQLYDLAGEVPPLDLNFAGTKTLDPRVTFTRASTATFVGSDGLLKTAVTNLVLRSEEFDNASWTKNNLQAFGSGSIANATIAPNGTLTADKIVENTATSQHMVFQSTTPEAGKAYVLSFYAKAAERTFVTAAFSGGGLSTDCRFGVNLNTGEIVSGSTAGSPELTQVTPIGDGWYRLALIKTMPSASGLQPRILMSTNGTAQSYLGDGTSGLFVWGAQLEQASTVGDYVPTTSAINSAPRFDHNPTTGESLGLLVEEARTNLVPTSEALANITGASITNNTTTAPDGLVTADTLIEDTSTGGHSVNTASNTWAGNTSYTFSIFLKANTRTQALIAFGTSSNWVNGQRNATFDLSTGTVIATAGSPVVASIQAFPGGWYRCGLTVTSVAVPTGASTVQVQMYTGGSASYTGNGTSGLFFWGAQLEAGAFPTSYIPTTTATVTRAADVASITGSNFSSWYNQTEGTVFADAKVTTVAPATSLTSVFALSDGTTNNRITVYKRANADTSTRLDVSTSGSSVAFINAGTFSVSNLIAASYRVDDFAISLNGLTPGTDTLGTVPTVSRLNIGNYADSTFPLNGTIKRLTYWPIRLANTTLQQITQP
jgi:hypothetical protein